MSDSSGNEGKKRIVANRGTTAKFRELLERSPGQVFYMKDLVEALRVSEAIIQNTASRIISNGVTGYRVHIPARAWVYAPDGKVANGSKRMFEELAVTKDGTILIQDEEGTVYKAQEL